MKVLTMHCPRCGGHVDTFPQATDPLLSGDRFEYQCVGDPTTSPIALPCGWAWTVPAYFPVFRYEDQKEPSR